MYMCTVAQLMSLEVSSFFPSSFCSHTRQLENWTVMPAHDFAFSLDTGFDSVTRHLGQQSLTIHSADTNANTAMNTRTGINFYSPCRSLIEVKCKFMKPTWLYCCFQFLLKMAGLHPKNGPYALCPTLSCLPTLPFKQYQCWSSLTHIFQNLLRVEHWPLYFFFLFHKWNFIFYTRMHSVVITVWTRHFWTYKLISY